MGSVRAGLKMMPGGVPAHCTERIPRPVMAAMRMALDDLGRDIGPMPLLSCEG